MTQKSKTFQEFLSHDQIKLQAWYGTKDIESTYAFHLVNELVKYSQVKTYEKRRLEIVATITREKKSRSDQFRKALGSAMSTTEIRPVNALVYYALECYDEIRTQAVVATTNANGEIETHAPAPPTKGRLRKAVEEKLHRKVTPKQWERTLADARLWMLSEDPSGRRKLATNKVKARR
jgi:hypothetical protein